MIWNIPFHEINSYLELIFVRSHCLSACFIAKIAKRILIKFGIVCELLHEHDSGPVLAEF